MLDIFKGLDPTLFGLGLIGFGVYQIVVLKDITTGVGFIVCGISDMVHKRNDLPGQPQPK